MERLHAAFAPATRDRVLAALEKGAQWLAQGGETHGVLSNHLAAAAAALDVAGAVLGTDRFHAARDRYIQTIRSNQNPEEGWLREYGGADPGYQCLTLFYLGEIWHRTRDDGVLETLKKAARFQAWFAHPDGTMGGEYASRGTKFAWPCGFETLAPAIPDAAAVAVHLRRCLEKGRGIGPAEMDPWNHFPMLNNYFLATERAVDLPHAPALPWKAEGAVAVFPAAGLAVAQAAGRKVAASPGLGGSVKLWDCASGLLEYEDCGYMLRVGKKAFVSQTTSSFQQNEDALLSFDCEGGLASVPGNRFDAWRFMAFRLFMLTLGRRPRIAKAIKTLLVTVLIRRRHPHPGRLHRSLRFDRDGGFSLSDRVENAAGAEPIARQVPIHMGSARYGDLADWLGPLLPPPPLSAEGLRRVDFPLPNRS